MKDKRYRLRDIPKGKRLRHFLTYYKPHLFFALAAAVLLGHALYGLLKPKADLQVMWLSDQYTMNCEYALRDLLESLDWDVNGDGKTNLMLTYIDFDREYSQLSYDVKSEITILTAGQEYSFFLVNGCALSWMRENDILASWEEVGAPAGTDGCAVVPLSRMEAFSGDFLAPLRDCFLCVTPEPEEPSARAEYRLQTEALHRFLSAQGVWPGESG
ncbi:MAG: hypothetical protein K2L38_01955 [Dysosmobacter sp.]|nr:hypothetical protein [Dysosmobacter sp.]